jgi:hypothetical protein
VLVRKILRTFPGEGAPSTYIRTHSLAEVAIDFSMALAESDESISAAAEGLDEFLRTRGVERKSHDPFQAAMLEWLAIVTSSRS